MFDFILILSLLPYFLQLTAVESTQSLFLKNTIVWVNSILLIYFSTDGLSTLNQDQKRMCSPNKELLHLQ
jgi:hypothetical protein